MKKEIWKKIETHGGVYEVSSHGAVRNTVTGAVKAQRLRSGYPSVKLCYSGKCKDYTVHYLVTLAFLGQRIEGQDVDHIDNNRENNFIENLQYLTRAQNIKKTFNGKRAGVQPSKKTKNTPQRYRADIWIFGKRYHLGSFENEELARNCYNQTHKEFFGYI